ncbi:MAG: DDE-type integrase/transposase/recombinase [Candidatus Saccharimonadales bacterium]
MTKSGFDAILVIVCRLSKKTISIPTTRTVNSRDLAGLFLEHVYRHFGAPMTIVSDRGPQFISAFWNEFCNLLGIKQKLSTAHHAQTDGQTEIMNQVLATRLKPYLDYYQDDWDLWLPLMDHATGALCNASTGLPPFLVSLGFEPRTSFDWRPLPQGPRTEVINREEAQEKVKKMEEIWSLARKGMEHAQEQMRIQANKHRREPDFNVGDSVYLSLKEYRIDQPSRKLSRQNDGPFLIVEKVGNAYRLDLPKSMKIHQEFSPDKLRKAAMDPLPGQITDSPEPMEIDGENEWEVNDILASRIHRGKLQYQVNWKGFDPDFI